MVEKATGRSIRRVHWTDVSPRFWEKLTHRGRLHLCEVLPSVDASEMGEVSCEVELVGNDCEASGLLQVKL